MKVTRKWKKVPLNPDHGAMQFRNIGQSTVYVGHPGSIWAAVHPGGVLTIDLAIRCSARCRRGESWLELRSDPDFFGGMKREYPTEMEKMRRQPYLKVKKAKRSAQSRRAE